jgi:hypothetical protein
VDGKVGKFGASLYTRLVSFARIEPMLNPILVEPTTLHKEFISPPFTKKKKQTKQINSPRGQNGHFHCPFPCFIFHLIIFFKKTFVPPQFSPTIIPHFHHYKYLFRQVINFNLM